MLDSVKALVASKIEWTALYFSFWRITSGISLAQTLSLWPDSAVARLPADLEGVLCAKLVIATDVEKPPAALDLTLLDNPVDVVGDETLEELS